MASNGSAEQVKHTPGPWEVDSGMVQTVAEHTCEIPSYGNYVLGDGVLRGVHIPIAWMDREPGNGTMPGERDANARLIAAAPELLDALRNIVDAAKLVHERWEHGDLADAVNSLRVDTEFAEEVIAKATA